MDKNELRKRLEASALGNGNTQNKIEEPTERDVSVLLWFRRMIGMDRVDPSTEAKNNLESLSGANTGAETARLFADKKSRAN